jgi:glycerol-3-phosphate dehydrogenase (NAD(P)+)
LRVRACVPAAHRSTAGGTAKESGSVKAAVLGAGAWGTTFAQVLCDAGTPVTLWSRRAELAEIVNSAHESPDYLPGIALPAALRATADPAEALAEADLVALAVPAQTLRHHLAAWRDLLPAGALLVSLMKGIELGTGDRMSQVIAEATGAGPDRIAVISGPNLAPEIAARQYSATVAACADEGVASQLQKACHTGYFRAYTNTDVIGCELGGAVKNVIALAVGIAGGMGLGDNTRAMLITRGLAEIARLGAALGADQHTFAGLAGMGDLVASCSSPLARNRSFGEKLGRGMSLADVLASTTQTVEGVKSSESVLQLAREHDVEMPITEVIAGVMHDGLQIDEAVLLLASRSAKPERYGV